MSVNNAVNLKKYAGHCCPNKEAAMINIVVSLTCTTYLCGAFIALYNSSELRAMRRKHRVFNIEGYY